MFVVRHPVNFDDALVSSARDELLDGTNARAPFRSGFVLGVDAPPPACGALAEALRPAGFALSFIKLAVGTPPRTSEGPFYEGPHLDSHPALDDSTELLRVLFNMSIHPRRFLFAAADRWELERRGVAYGRTEFEMLELPDDIELRETTIPGRSKGVVHALRFYASAIPHVGLNDPPEHFLMSFERLSAAAPRRTPREDRAHVRR